MARRWHLLIIALLILPVGSDAELYHAGGLNSCGCHVNRSSGECHCHKAAGCGCRCQPAKCNK